VSLDPVVISDDCFTVGTHVKHRVVFIALFKSGSGVLARFPFLEAHIGDSHRRL